MRRHRNCRKSQSLHVMTGRFVHVGGIIAALVTMVVINLVAEARCSQTTRSIREKEKLLVKLEQDRQRESDAWDQMTTAANLDRALINHGLDMRYPKSEQVIRMDASGTPRYGQESVKLAMNRLGISVPVASNTRARRRR